MNRLPCLLVLACAVMAPTRSSSATSAPGLTVSPGFQVELLYRVPRESAGSWVALAVDSRGRLIVAFLLGSRG